jgi:two-component system nitrogen regulation sensor histidine kinase NtrY
MREILAKAAGGRSFYIGLATAVLSLLASFGTYLVLTGLTPVTPTHNVVVTGLLINLAFVLAMLAVITVQVAGLWSARRQKLAGSRLHVRFISLFSIIAIMPAIILAVFASISLDRGLDHWFSTRTKLIIDNSLEIAMAYVREHSNLIRSDIVGMAKDLDSSYQLVRTAPEQFGELLNSQAALRAIPQAYLISGDGKLLAAAANRMRKSYSQPPSRPLEAAVNGDVIVIAPSLTNKVRAIKKLENFRDTYLYVLRSVDPKVIKHLRQTREKVREYGKLEQGRTGVQVAFGLMFLVVALTLLLVAIWLGIWFADRFVTPIRRLIGAAQQVAEGNLDVGIPVNKSLRDNHDEVEQLIMTFNKMTSRVRNQRDALINTNTILDERREFIETVLAGVTAGVIGIDETGRITLANRSAKKMLAVKESALVGKTIDEAVPEFGEFFNKNNAQKKIISQQQIDMIVKGSERNFEVRLATERLDDVDHGYVLTFDDITELVVAQRTSAWADIARRIAHEIKNPLTPIQLSAERLKRKYGNKIAEDTETFHKCTNTIIRQVGDIGRMVDEFSSFARMPKPDMKLHDMGKILRETTDLFQMVEAEIDFDLDLPSEPVITLCDRRLISQAVTNLIKNSTEAIASAREAMPDDKNYRGKLQVHMACEKGEITIGVVDNGCGLPTSKRSRLLEPYVTTRAKGTGLGLAIVNKIVEQHRGCLLLEDAEGIDDGPVGARMLIVMPYVGEESI